MARHLIILTPLILWFCEQAQVELEPFPLESRIAVKIEQLHLCETGCEPTTYLTLTTDVVYGCLNYWISSEYDLTWDQMTIDVDGILPPSGCLTAVGPATSGWVIDLTPGEYKLDITYLDSVDHYTLDVTDTLITVEESTHSFSYPAFDEFYLNRDDVLSWGYESDTTNQWVEDLIEGQLQGVTELQELAIPDSAGGAFFEGFESVRTFREHSDSSRYLNFRVMQYEPDITLEEIGLFLDALKPALPDSGAAIYLELRDYWGERYRL